MVQKELISSAALDRGSQYTSHLFQQRLQQAEAVASMSRKGDCYDNAAAESFLEH